MRQDSHTEEVARLLHSVKHNSLQSTRYIRTTSHNRITRNNRRTISGQIYSGEKGVFRGNSDIIQFVEAISQSTLET